MLFVLFFYFVFVGNAGEVPCGYPDVSEPIAAIACAVETGIWRVPANSTALENVGCLLGQVGTDRCRTVAKVPLQSEVEPSPPAPKAKNQQYQELAEKAELIVPKTWWRDGYAYDGFLLSRNDKELPRKQLDLRQLSNKKLRNIHQCVTRQQFIRKSLDYDSPQTEVFLKQRKCNAMEEAVVQKFQQLWLQNLNTFGGEIVVRNGQNEWIPNRADGGKLLMSALEVIDLFMVGYGGIWTGCFKLEKFPECRGALSAAAMVASTNLMYDISANQKRFTESQFIRGYLLASLGRGLMHGDTSSTGNVPKTSWKVKLVDFISLQAAWLRLYIDSFGMKYVEQVDKYLPYAFPPSFKVHAKTKWKEYANQLEPVYTSMRNWMFTESNNLIDFGPYRPLVSFPNVRKEIVLNNRKRVLIDVGANGFFASPKYLLDSYTPYLPFTDAIMIEPEPHFSATIPKAYSDRYNITFMQIYAEVGTDSKTDMLKLLPTMVTPEDFVVLKFDVDPNKFAYGPTMEWGFLFSIMQRPEIAQLVDEVYIEMHFHFPSLYWYHYHSNWEAFDAMRYLRLNGVIVHSWP